MRGFVEKSVWVLLATALLLVLAAPAGAKQPTNATAVEAAQAKPLDRKAPPAQTTIYHGNLKSHKFHAPGCRYYYCKNCRAVFKSRQAAIRAGYIPCKVCRP